jgi:hypothetical protein
MDLPDDNAVPEDTELSESSDATRSSSPDDNAVPEDIKLSESNDATRNSDCSRRHRVS